jgi:type 1 glutamine amidotransferase
MEPIHILVSSKTTPDAYRHESIPAGIEAFERLGASTGDFVVTATEDATVFEAQSLARYDAIVFLQAGGDFLNAQQLDALKQFVDRGGGVVGIHAATTGMPTRRPAAHADDASEREPVDAVDGDGWYGQLLGAEFAQHPEPQWGQITICNAEHPIMREAADIIRRDSRSAGEGPSSSAGIERWRWFDEWYDFKQDPRRVLGDRLVVLLTVDETSYKGGKMNLGSDHAVAWCHEDVQSGARVFYTALGHFDEAYRDAAFMAHVHDGLLWVTKRT